MTYRFRMLTAAVGVVFACGLTGCKSAGSRAASDPNPPSAYAPPALNGPAAPPAAYAPSSTAGAYGAVAEPAGYRPSASDASGASRASAAPRAGSCPSCASGGCSM